ncbi:MAG: hypothetical protein ACI9DK_001954 [Vicingaceae bacterium]|jgi:hypothetical protein
MILEIKVKSKEVQQHILSAVACLKLNYCIFVVMRKVIFLLAFCSLLTSNISAQYSMDFGISIGGSNYIGEIGGGGTEPKPWILDMNLAKSSLGVGGFYRMNFTRNIAAKFSVNYVRITGADSLSGIATQIARNLSFRTDIYEAAIQLEYYFFNLRDISRVSNARIDFGTYFFVGGGAALFNPKASYQDEWIDLRPLRTEGQEKEYDSYAIVVPMGMGVNFTFDRKIKLGIEFGYRFTNTDYLDDISDRYAAPEDLAFNDARTQNIANRSAEAFARGDARLEGLSLTDFQPGSIRGNPETMDGYLLGQISLSYNIASKNSFSKARYNSIINRKRKRTKF